MDWALILPLIILFPVAGAAIALGALAAIERDQDRPRRTRRPESAPGATPPEGPVP